jgi:Uma2 family endonuclease
MATVSRAQADRETDYLYSDGKPLGETEYHVQNLLDVIDTLQIWFANKPLYVAGNMFVHYERGNRRKHISPDVFAVWDIPKSMRYNYLVWQEGKPPDMAIELTSRTTRIEDVEDKFYIYQDILKVPEYFLFDPHGDYLDPRLQGYRLSRGKYRPIKEVAGRLPSKVLSLHLGTESWRLRLYDPQTGQRLLTGRELAAQTLAGQQQTERALQEVQAENERLRRELETLRRAGRRKGT